MKISFDPEMTYAMALGPTVPFPSGVEVLENEYVPPLFVGEIVSIPNPLDPE